MIDYDDNYSNLKQVNIQGCKFGLIQINTVIYSQEIKD